MKERCWQRQFDKTYSLLSLLKDELSVGDLTYKTNRDFENYCVKSRKVIQVMKDELSVFDANQKLKKQVKDSKRLVADQLLRSEEHTSELQSRGHLVCRLLLEKKKKKI